MNVTLRSPMTVEQFLAWEERQEGRYEFDGFQPVAMVGGTIAHSTIQANLIATLGLSLRGKPCRVHGSHIKIAVAGRIRYPDAFVVCTPQSPTATVAAEPVVVFEIMSPSTASTDMMAKNAEYLATPSIMRYVLLEQTEAAAMTFVRTGDAWACNTSIGSDATLPLPEIGINLSLVDVYADVVFPDKITEQ